MKDRNDITEDFLHFIWKNKMFDTENLVDDSGNKIEIINTGTQNTNAGPDFFNAKIKINNTLWAGNIEIHKKSSDWYKHNHHKDKAYNNVILHVSIDNDKTVFNEKLRQIPALTIKYNGKLLKNYKELKNKNTDITCKKIIPKINKYELNAWLSAILTERTEEKTKCAKSVLKQTNNNYEEMLYITTAKAFGFKINALPFKMLAESLPLKIISKHKTNKFQTEALLFGQAGMLKNTNINDPFYLKLKNEYKFLKHKYKLTPTDPELWKFMRVRPSNFPTIRISQFADLLHKSTHLFSKITEAKNIRDIEKLFEIQAGNYWNTHYRFGQESSFKKKTFGKSARNNILINTVIPVLFLYGKEKDKPEIIEKAINFLENIKAEKNKITKKWEDAGLKIKNAYFSQSLIQLYNTYCINKKCLDCRIGYKYIQKEH
ncbi:MAG: DUF2851 family protein [Chlorobi bacterium]|nr:DUF2851 family protein [Chlorobiota bacterium]